MTSLKVIIRSYDAISFQQLVVQDNLCWVGDLKSSTKYDSGLRCHWALFTTKDFGFKLQIIFHRVEFKKPVEYSICQSGVTTSQAVVRVESKIGSFSWV